MASSFAKNWLPLLITLAILLVLTKFFSCPPCAMIKGLFSSSAEEDDGIAHVTTETFEAEVLRSSAPVLVDFYATWCGPCRLMSPVLADLADELTNAKIVKVDVDENPELANRYKVSSIPNLIVFKDGKPAAQHLGLADKVLLKRLLQN